MFGSSMAYAYKIWCVMPWQGSSGNNIQKEIIAKCLLDVVECVCPYLQQCMQSLSSYCLLYEDEGCMHC